MKHTYTVILAILLVIALAVPAFASEHPGIPSGSLSHGDYYVLFAMGDNGDEYKFVISDEPFIIEKGETLYNLVGENALAFEYIDGVWNELYHADIHLTLFDSVTILSANHNLMYGNTVYFSANVQCDGTSCPATDINHDNICDDCGQPLAMSLRSSLLDYAKAQAMTFPEYEYFAVVEHSTETSRYDVYISKTAMFCEPPDYETVYGESLLWFQVHEGADGTFSHTGELSVQKWSGEPIYANHTIANFREPPLAVTIQGVTGEAIQVQIPNLTRTITTIVLCGVGCLALLILLHLLGKKSQIFHL